MGFSQGEWQNCTEAFPAWELHNSSSAAYMSTVKSSRLGDYRTGLATYKHDLYWYVSDTLNVVSFPDPPPKRKGGSGEYSTSSDHGLAIAMDSAKWFAVRKPSTGEIIAKSANQIVPPEFRWRYKNVVLYSPDPPFLLEDSRGVWGRDYAKH